MQFKNRVSTQGLIRRRTQAGSQSFIAVTSGDGCNNVDEAAQSLHGVSEMKSFFKHY